MALKVKTVERNSARTGYHAIRTSGSGTATVTKDGNVVAPGSSLSEDDEVEIPELARLYVTFPHCASGTPREYERKKTEAYEEENPRSGGKGDSSRAHGIFDGNYDHELYGLRPVLKMERHSSF